MPVTKQRNRTKILDVSPYAGKWIAILNDKIIDSADELKTLMTQLSDQKLAQEPSVMRVPRKDQGPFVFIL
ncbi:MAG: hypothetical protein IIA88_04255 [Bacteroidetes bacterium]|nr:hypothetical protein [Bacteroidota bacterium]